MNQSLNYEIASVMKAALATGLFISRCTLSAPDGSTTVNGSPGGPYVPVPGLTYIRCMDAPESETRIQATEVRDMREIESKQFRHVLLDGYYPTIPYQGAGQGWKATVDGVDYICLGAEVDSQRTQTRLHLELVSV